MGAGSLTAVRLGRRLQSSIRFAWGGPECRAVLGGSINLTAVLLELEKEARHRSELARACTSRPLERKSGVSWCWWSCRLGQFGVVVVIDGLVFEAADLAVPEPVVAEGEDLAGDRDLGECCARGVWRSAQTGRAAGRRRWGSSARLRSAPSAAPASPGGRCARDELCRQSCARSARAPPTHTGGGLKGSA